MITHLLPKIPTVSVWVRVWKFIYQTKKEKKTLRQTECHFSGCTFCGQATSISKKITSAQNMVHLKKDIFYLLNIENCLRVDSCNCKEKKKGASSVFISRVRALRNEMKLFCWKGWFMLSTKCFAQWDQTSKWRL